MSPRPPCEFAVLGGMEQDGQLCAVAARSFGSVEG